MTDVHLRLDEATVTLLRARAERLGIDPEQLIARVIEQFIAQDPLEFVGVVSSDAMRGRDTDEQLARHGFGAS